MSLLSPELGVFDLPCAFSTSTAEEINEVLNQSDFKTKLDDYFANAGLKCLGFTQGASFRQFSSNKKLTSIEDFKGLNHAGYGQPIPDQILE